MEVFVVLINDRHADPDITLFRTEEDAINWAVCQIPEYADVIGDVRERDSELTPDMQRDGYVLFLTYSGEGDYVTVMKREVK